MVNKTLSKNWLIKISDASPVQHTTGLTVEPNKPNKYLAYFMEDAYINGRYEFLTHTSAMAVASSGWVPQGEFIWYNEARRPGIFGYPTTMITNRTHASILFFKKVVKDDRLNKDSD